MTMIEVAAIEGRGKGVIASGGVKAGDIILRDSPLLLYSPNPNSSNSRLYCANCFKSIASIPSHSLLITCPSCAMGAVFCSTNCRSTALSTSHSPWVCNALLSISSHHHRHHSDDFIAQARFLVAAYNLSSHSPADFHLLLSLQGGTHSQPQGHEREQAVALHSLIASLNPPSSFPLASPGLTAALLAVDKFNAFGLMEPFDPASPHRNVRSYAIYPKASSFNHDCLPNACCFDMLDNPTGSGGNCDMIVRAIHDISQGREICISYFPVNWNYADRQRRLSEDYGFECGCDRCQVESKWKHQDHEDEDDSMEDDEDDDFPHAYFFLNFLCDTDNCWGTLAPLPPSEASQPNLMECNVCGRLCTKELDFKNDDEDMQDD
ncbi:hypothetical protein Syun_024162 [Stephania yunnanensis]|uniref:SET domain-containing protein n=1 Tax=Stephania yunnanensis TaxID=152371 RepID=A0AAP0I3R2_9MAGN